MFDRRAFLRIGSIATFGSLPWADIARLQAASGTTTKKDISIIHLWLAGGLRHLDTFDMKVQADHKYRTPFKSIPSSVPGLHVAEPLPHTGEMINKVTLI